MKLKSKNWSYSDKITKLLNKDIEYANAVVNAIYDYLALKNADLSLMRFISWNPDPDRPIFVGWNRRDGETTHRDRNHAVIYLNVTLLRSSPQNVRTGVVRSGVWTEVLYTIVMRGP
jgi:hypothetical protein